MAAILPVVPVGPVVLPPAMHVQAPAMHVHAPGATGFADLLASGLSTVDARVAKADALVAAFAKGDAVPVHEVTLALEQARLSIELATEVRTRLLDAYRDFMAMQL